MILKRADAATVLLVSIALLSACATPSPEPTVPPSVEPTAEPSPEPLSAPQSSLPLDCEQVVPTTAVTPAFVTPVQLLFDESSTPTGISGAGFVQGGGLLCLWGAEASGTGYHEGLGFHIAPASAAEFEAGMSVTDISVLDTLGDRSVLSCFLQPAGYNCGADVLVGEYWMSGYVRDTGEGFTLESASATATDLLGQVVAALDAADPPRALWSAPADAVDGATLCADPKHAAAVLSVDPASLSVIESERSPEGAQALAAARAPGVGCLWTAGDAWVSIEALKGGAWWSELLATAPPAAAPHYMAPVTIQVPGADAAYLSANDGGSVVILFTGGSAVVLSFAERDPALATALATAFAATLAG